MPEKSTVKFCVVFFFLKKVPEGRCKTLQLTLGYHVKTIAGKDFAIGLVAQPEKCNRFLHKKQKLFFTNYVNLLFSAGGRPVERQRQKV